MPAEAATFDDGDLTLRATLPRSTGLSLAVNAIPDAYLLIDAPHCAYRRLAYIQGNHDLESTLAIVPGMPRVTNTELSPLKVIKNRDAELEEQLTALARYPDAGVVLVDAVAMALITASDYGRICAAVEQKTGRAVAQVPHRSLNSDYLSAYAEVMELLASKLPLDSGTVTGAGNRVAIVGLMWDRNEGDHRGNLAELQRMMSALGLELVSTWFSGRPTAELMRVQDADWVVSLPYGRRAARVLSRRLGRPLIHAELPFGVPATIRFAFAIGAATGRIDAALSYVERELSEVLPRLKWIVPFALLHRRLGYVGDPHLFRGMRETAALLGCTLPFAAFTNLPAHERASEPLEPNPLDTLQLPDDIRGLASLRPAKEPDCRFVYPHARELTDTLDRLARECGLDLLLTNSFGFLTDHVATVELGFPSYHTHFLTAQPFLGMRGFLGTVERMVNASRAFEVRAAHEGKKTRGPQ